MSNLYDRVRYPPGVYVQTHPAMIGALATLHGRKVAPFGASRVLEIGCGEGLNLINMALGAPGAEFVGVDLAETAIAAAREMAARTGVANVHFRALDLAAIDGAFGEFDTIIAHGVYAWTPEPVRNALMRVMSERLSADGLAFVSFNALPGARFQQALRDMLVFLTEGVEDPKAALDLAWAFLGEQIETWSDKEADQALMKGRAKHMLAYKAEVLYHDELSAHWAPELLSQVVARAAAFGLSYVCDARPKLNTQAFFPTEAYASIRARANGDWARFEQLADFRELRTFKNSVFARGGAVDQRRAPARLRGLWASADLWIEEPDPDAQDGALLLSQDGVKLRSNNPELVGLLTRLTEAYPLSLPLADTPGLDSLADHLFGLFVSGVVQLYSAPLALARVPGERPAASRLALEQAARGETVLPSLLQSMVELEDRTWLAMFPLMDGTRTRAELAENLRQVSSVPPGEAMQALDELVAGLARVGLMAG